MQQSIKSRTTFSLTSEGISLRGTLHFGDERSGFVTVPRDGRLGLLFVNQGFLPRAGAGDSAVYWADSLARGGYPSFRLDLPFLGDSGGDVSMDLLDYINDGGYAARLSEAITNLVERFNLAGMVIVGHCAGAVSSSFTAAICKDCKGLVLLDPYFHLPPKRLKVQNELSRWASSGSRIGRKISDLYDVVKKFRLLVRGGSLPGNTNWPLLRSWGRLTSGKLPILILKAPSVKGQGTNPRAGTFDYLRHFQAASRQNGKMVVEYIEGTNHSFADPLGRVAVKQQTERWLRATFPSLEHSSGIGAKEINQLQTTGTDS